MLSVPQSGDAFWLDSAPHGADVSVFAPKGPQQTGPGQSDLAAARERRPGYR
jgi:hypothetical protein